MSMPGLQPRPTGPMIRPNLPLATGSLNDQLSRISSGLADYMRLGMEDLLRELSAQGSPEATIKGLQLELEKMQWRHSQEMVEMKQSVDTMLKDMKTSLEKETQRTVDNIKKQANSIDTLSFPDRYLWQLRQRRPNGLVQTNITPK